MVTDEHECLGHSKGTEAGRQGDLRGLVHDAIVKLSSKEERTRGQASALCTVQSLRCGQADWSIARQVAATTGGAISRASI